MRAEQREARALRIAEIVRLQHEGLSTRQIAARLGISQPRVMELLRVDPTADRVTAAVRAARRATRAEAIVGTWRRTPLTQTEIAKAHGVSRRTVCRVLSAAREER